MQNPIGPGGKTPATVFRSNLCNYSCKWSPFDGTKVAVAQAQYYGMVGSGAVSLLNVDPMTGMASLVRQLMTPDTTFDVCFSEAN